MPTVAVVLAVGVIASSVHLHRVALTAATLVVDLAAVSMTANACKAALAMTAGLRRVVLVVVVTTVVLLRVATVKVLAASQALVSRPAVVSRHGMKAPPHAVISRRARSRRSPSRVLASLLFRMMRASARHAPHADRCMKKPAF